MNFLAHLLLTPPDPESKLGSILPDLSRGPLSKELPPRVLDAAKLHRRVDRITDTHPRFIASRDRLTSLRPRLRGIVADVLYDHLLTLAWPRYCDIPLPTFIADAYADLRATVHLTKPETAAVIGRMIEGDWLSAYGDDEGLAVIFSLMSRRLTSRVQQTIDLAPALDDLAQHRAALAADFAAFFPDLRARLAT